MNESKSSSVFEPTYRFTVATRLLGAQMLFVAFGALAARGGSPAARVTGGAGTLLFQLLTRGQVPVFLASSFAFSAPIIYGAQTWGIPATQSGLAAAGVVYVILSGVGLSNRFSVIFFRACREELLHLFFPAGQVQVLPAG